MFGSSVGVLIHEAPVDRCSLQNVSDRETGERTAAACPMGDH